MYEQTKEQIGGSYRGGAMLGIGNARDDAAQRQPETIRFLEELEKNLVFCDEALDRLSSRLERVTRTGPEVGGGLNPNTPREGAQTKLGAGIQQMADRVSAVCARMRSLTERLEV